MTKLYEFLQPILENYNLTYPSKQETLDEFQKRMGDVPEEIERIVEFLFDNAESGSYPIIFGNFEKEKLKAKVQRVNWNKFESFVDDNLSDSIQEKKAQLRGDDSSFLLYGKQTVSVKKHPSDQK